uniref:YSIRK-type signal peptide-containing protein n=1 Tax=Streptococcus sp. 1453 TaxID=2582661 RepID=UPI0015928777
MKYKRTQKRSKQMWQRVEKFSIRKFSFGAASCLIGASLVGAATTPDVVDAALVTFRDQQGGNVTTLYSNKGDTPFSAPDSSVHDRVNVDQEIDIKVDWSKYSKTNPYVTVTYKYNGGFNGTRVAKYSGRPDFWFTTPVGVTEPTKIILYNGSNETGREMTSWTGDKPWVSGSNSVGSRYQNKDMSDKLDAGNPKSSNRYNDATGERGWTYRGDLNGMFWWRVGDSIDGSPSAQGIYDSFRNNTRSMYSDWERAAHESVTVEATYKVIDPTLKNGKYTLDFGAGVKVGRGLSFLSHFKVSTVEVPPLYKDKEFFEPKLPDRLGVGNTTSLTQKEKDKLKEKIWEVNQDNTSSSLPEDQNKFVDNLKDGKEGIKIGNDGTATITYKDDSTDVIPGTSLVYEDPNAAETIAAERSGYSYKKNPYPVEDINNIKLDELEKAVENFYAINGMKLNENKIISVGEGVSDKFIGKFISPFITRSGADYGKGFIVGDDTTPKPYIPKEHLFKQKVTINVDSAIEKGKKAIEDLTYLSPKEKEYYKNQLTGKTTQDDINNVVNAAIAKNSENEKAIEAKKRQVKDKINSAKYLTEAEKEALRKQVDNQAITDPADGDGTGNKAADYTKELLDKIGQQADAKNLENAKTSTKEKIDQIKDSLKNPTADEYKTQIDGKTTVAEVEKVLKEAETQKSQNEAQKAQEEANKLKEEYKQKIDQIPGLSEEDKRKYKEDVDAADSKAQLDRIIEDAEIKGIRDKAIATIGNLLHLNEAQKTELTELLKEAGNKDEIDTIVTRAQELDSKMDSLQQLVAEAKKVKESETYNTAAQDKKTAFDKAKDAASKVADKNTADPENAAGTSEVATLIDNLAKAIKELTGKEVAVPVSKDALKAEIDLNKDDAVKKSPAYAKETDVAKKKAYDAALEKAQEVYDKQDATQPEVDDALDKLQQARLALSGKAEDFTLGVKNGAAKISVVPKVGENLTEQADRDAVKAKVTANGKDLDNTYTVEYGEIAEKGGKTVVPVTVTHDGITRTVDVPVEGSTAATTTPTADTAKLSETPVKDSQVTKDEDVQKVKDAVKVPAGTQVTDKKLLDEGKVVEGTDQSANGGANNAGKPVVKVEVTYGDGSKDVVEVPVEGNTAATTTPTADTAKLSETPVKDSKVTKAEDEQAIKDAVKVPAGTQVTDKKLLDEGKVVEGTDQSANGGANNAGKPVVKVEVTYGDGSKDVVEVPVEGNTAATTTPTADTAKLSETPVKDSKVTKAEDEQAIKDAVKVPAGTQVTDKKLLDEGK